MEEENKLVIPDIAYNIPVKEFFSWYDDVLTHNWNLMTAEDRIKYFESIDLDYLRKQAVSGLKQNGCKDISISEIEKSLVVPNKNDFNKSYYRVMEFQKLENDIVLLQAMARKFFAYKAISKMKQNARL